MVGHLDEQLVEKRLQTLHLFVQHVSTLQVRVDHGDGLLAIFLILDGLHGAALLGGHDKVKLGVLAVAARIAQKGILLVVVDGPALVALENILTAVAAHPGYSRHRSGTTRALKRLGGGLGVVVKLGELDHQIARHDRQSKFHLHLGLTLTQSDLLGAMPEGGLVLEFEDGLHLLVVVVDDERLDHLGFLEIVDLERELGDGVRTDQLDDLRGGRELGVDLDGGKLEVAERLLGVVAHQTGVPFEVVASKVHQAFQGVVDVGVGVVGKHLVLSAHQTDGPFHVALKLRLRKLSQLDGEVAEQVNELGRPGAIEVQGRPHLPNQVYQLLLLLHT